MPSVVQSEFYEATRILFVRKKNLNNDNFFFSTIRLLSVSPRQHSAILDITHRTQAAYALLHLPQWKKSLICIFFAYKKYLRQFIQFRLNHWWQMDFPGDAFHFFLDLNGVIFLTVNGTVTSLPVRGRPICVFQGRYRYRLLQIK